MGFFVETLDADTMLMAATADKRDVDAVADHCKALSNSGQGNGKDEKLAMRVDFWVINNWCVNKGVTFAEFMRDQRMQTRFIEDPDNAAFRVWRGKL